MIAAVSALSGVTLSEVLTLFRETLKCKHQRYALPREKYEEMGLAFLASLKHYTDLQRIKAQEELFRYAQNFDANKCYLLCDLYFPELRDVALSYVLSYVKVYEGLALASQELDGEKCLHEIVANVESHQQNKRSYEEAKNALDRAISINTKTYTNT